jgi:hypothetical protein
MIRPFVGATVPPRSPDGLQLYLRVAAPATFFTDSGRGAGSIAHTTGVRISYRHDGDSFDTKIPEGLVLCEKRTICDVD